VSDTIKIIHYCLLAMLLVVPTVQAEENQKSITLLIENVRLVTPASESTDAEDPLLNLVLRDRKLDIVTKDEVPLEEFTLTIDAQGNYLLGQLELGAEPDFLILDDDPRTNFAVLRDSKEHILVAVEKGNLVENRLGVALETPESQALEAERSGKQQPTKWLAYMPPPMALPSGYQDTSKWNRWESKAIDGIFLGAIALDRARWSNQSDTSVAQVGDLDDFSGGDIRGLRFGVVGTLNFPTPWVYTVFGATNAFSKGFDQEGDDDFEWFDYRIDIPVFKGAALSVGKQKEPISIARSTPMIFMPMQERAAAIDAMLPARNLGIVLSGGALEQRMAWAGGVFNNFIDSDESISDTPTQFVGRVSGVPFVTSDEGSLLHIAAAARYTNAKLGVRYFSEPEIDSSPVFIDTGNGLTDPFIGADHAITTDLEAAWRSGRLLLMGEYVQTDVSNSIVDGAPQGDLTFDGYYVSGAWSLTGEMREYNYKGGIFDRPPVAKSVYQNGIGAWELMARYSVADMDDGVVQGGQMNIASAGVRWWLTPFFSVDLNYRYIALEDPLGTGYSNVLNTRLLISLE
jgi:phosphate-selective porin OprO/OprP